MVGVIGFVTGVGDNVGVLTGDTGLAGAGTDVAVGGIGVADGGEVTVKVGEGDITGSATCSVQAFNISMDTTKINRAIIFDKVGLLEVMPLFSQNNFVTKKATG